MNKKEIIEELIFRNLPEAYENRRDFNALINNELARIPHKFGKYAKNFFVGKYLGAIYSFQYTSLKDSLGVHTTLWKYDTTKQCLHLVFFVEKDNVKKAYLRTIHIAITPSSDASRNNGAFLKDITFTQRSGGSITYLDNEGFRWDEQPGVTRESTSTNAINIDRITNELNNAGFITVNGGIPEKEKDGISEETVKDFSFKDITEVKKAFGKYLKINRKLLLNSFEVFKKELGQNFFKESFFNGFCFGGIVFNFKRRYRISIVVQRNTGMGRIDLGMISLGEDKENINPFLMITEFKTGAHSALEAIAQIKERYIDTWLNLKSFANQAVIAGINYNLVTQNQIQLRSDDIELEIISLHHFSIEKFLIVLSQANVKEKIQEILEHLCNSRYGIETFQNFFPLLVGNMLSYKAEQFEVLQKRLFIEDAEFARHRGILAIDFKNKYQAVNRRLFFNFKLDGEERDLRLLNTNNRANLANKAVDYLRSEALNQRQTIYQIDITVANKKETGKPFFQYIDYKSFYYQDGRPLIDLNQFSDIRKKFKSLNTVKFSDLFERPDRESFYQIKSDGLRYPLFELSKLLQNENDLQGFIQGVFSGVKVKQTNTEVRVFGEANYAASGQADFQIIVADVRRERDKPIEVKNTAVFVLELKHSGTSEHDILRQKAQEAYKQAEERYQKNADTTTPERQIKFLGFAFTPNSQSPQDCFSLIGKKRSIEQPSDDSEPSRGSPINKRRRKVFSKSNCNSPSSSKRGRRNLDNCIEYSLEEAEEKREIIEGLLQERKRGAIVLIADDNALLILASLRKEENSSGKLIVISESPEPLEAMHTVLGLVGESQNIDDWLQIVKKDFPTEGALLENNKNLIQFSELKAVLASEQKPLFKVISHSTKDFSSLGIDADNVAAIYLGNHQLPSKNWYSSLASDALNAPILYRKSLSKPRMIEKHQGSLDYFRELQAILELEKSENNNHLLEESLIGLGLAESFFLSANQALEEAGLGHEKSWMPLLDSIGKVEDHPSSLVFLNLQTYETRTLDVDIEPIREFQTYLRELHEAINPHFVFDHEEKVIRRPTLIEHVEAADGLNSAFLLQTLIAWSKQKDRADLNGLSQASGNTRLFQWIEIHNYIGLAQMGQGFISDVTKVVNLVKTLVSEGQVAVKSTLSAFRSGLNAFFNEGLGILFGVANVVMDTGELSEAKTQAQKDVFSTQLAFDVGGLFLSLGAGGASMMGATTTAGVLGALAVPLVGLNIGITGLVKAFEEVVANAQAVGNYFYQLDNAYRQLGYQKQVTSDNNSYMSPLYGAVIKEINFQTNTLHYGDSYLYSSQTKTGSGKSNYIFWASYFPKVIKDKTKAFSIRGRLGYSEVKKIMSSSDSFWILPSTPESYLTYSWKNLPFATTRRDRGFSVLRQLEEQEDFHYDFYIFPSEYIVSTITPEFIKTAIKIVLNSQERTLVMPQFSSQERFIAQYLDYTLESPKTAGKTILHLGEVSSLKLESHHANYNWELVCNNCTNQEGIQFTDTGIKIYGRNVEILNPSLGNYYLHLDSEVTYQLDLVKKQISPLEIDVAGNRNSTHLINDYLEKNSYHSSQNLLIKIDNYPMQNNQGENYNGTAFYSTEKDRYFYTDGLPDKAILAPYIKINSTYEIPTSLQINFIGCIEDLCYFWAPYNYFWSSDQNTHEIIRKYHISDKEIIAASIVADHSVQIETILDIYSKDPLLSRNSTDYFERHITYYVKPDGELYLASLSDSNDHLLHLFENDNGEVLISKNITHLVAENWEVGKHFHEENPHSFDQQQALWGEIQEQFTHRLNQFVSILPGTQNTRYTPLWIRAKNETDYQLINPGTQEKNLLCLGPLTMKNGTEVLYFYKPSNASANYEATTTQSTNKLLSVINHSEDTGKLFLKSSEEGPAKALDLSLRSAFRSQERIFVVTTEHLIKELDAFGKSYVTAVTADWIKTHGQYWGIEISTLLSIKPTETTGPISIYGLQDQSGNALGVWYDNQIQSFIFIQPPLNQKNKQLPINYLTSQGSFNFFFCSENGVLYQKKSYSGAVNEIFNGTQLKVKLPDLVPFVTSLKTISFQNKRWILEMQGGEIFSSPFLPANHWYLEKIGKDCIGQCELDRNSFPERTHYGDNNFRRSLLNLDSIFNKNCFDDKEKPVFFSRLMNNTIASFCSIDNFKVMNFIEQGSAPCLIVNPNKPIPVELNRWWLPSLQYYLFSIYHKATHSWEYLGLCKQTATQNELGACFFSKEDKMIYFAPKEKFWTLPLLNRHKTRMQAEFVQKQEDLFLLVIKADRPSDSDYYNEHFIPLLTEVKTIGLLLENPTPGPFKIHEEIISFYKTVFYQSNASQNTTLYFPPLTGGQFYVKKKGTDIILKHPYFDSRWVFVNAMEINAFNNTRFCFENVEIKEKVLVTEDGHQVIDNRSSYYEAIETIRQVFSQRTEKNLTLHYKLAFKGSQVHQYQSARLMLEQPGVKIQQNPSDMNKVFWQPDYLWWALGAGTITFFSAMALAASARYGFIRRQDPARENTIPLVTMVATAAALTPLLPEAQAYERPTFKGAAIHSGFSAARDCRKAETLIGLLGFCSQKEEIIYWHQAEKKSTVNFERYSLNHTEKDIHYLHYENKGEWKLDLNKLKLISLDEIQPYLSPNLYRRLAEQKKQQEILTIFRQQIVITSGHYLGNILALHTSMGDLFKAIGLAPDWRARDDIHFLSRCWITTQQLLSQQTFSGKLLSLSVGLSEVALLHPRIQSAYAYLTNNSDFSKAKTVIRFMGDLLQLGPYNFSYLARLLEFCFPNNESIWKLSLGLRMVSHFYLLTYDLSYWHLGMALFVLPYVPILLENLGVPATRGLHEVCHKLAQVFVGQSLLNKFSEDAERIAQRDRELMLADERVRKGREHLKHFAGSRFNFFVNNENVYPSSANDEIEREQSSQLTNPSLG